MTKRFVWCTIAAVVAVLVMLLAAVWIKLVYMQVALRPDAPWCMYEYQLRPRELSQYESPRWPSTFREFKKTVKQVYPEARFSSGFCGPFGVVDGEDIEGNWYQLQLYFSDENASHSIRIAVGGPGAEEGNMRLNSKYLAVRLGAHIEQISQPEKYLFYVLQSLSTDAGDYVRSPWDYDVRLHTSPEDFVNLNDVVISKFIYRTWKGSLLYWLNLHDKNQIDEKLGAESVLRQLEIVKRMSPISQEEPFFENLLISELLEIVWDCGLIEPARFHAELREKAEDLTRQGQSDARLPWLFALCVTGNEWGTQELAAFQWKDIDLLCGAWPGSREKIKSALNSHNLMKQ
jgi:hypothetical protein